MAGRERLEHWPPQAKVTVAFLMFIVVVVVAVGAAKQNEDGEGRAVPVPAVRPSDTVPATSASNAPTTASPSAPTSPSDGTGASGRELLAQLRLVDDPSSSQGYSRDLFPTWLDLDGNGCDAREDTLIVESLVSAEVERSGECEVISGRWLSVYDGVEVSEPSELDVDHLVPLAEAWRSGAYLWETDRRAAFANDLSYADHLIAVTASANRSKSDSPPNEWRPPRRETWCRYATAWVTVKVTWSLTATTAERDALGQMLDTC